MTMKTKIDRLCKMSLPKPVAARRWSSSTTDSGRKPRKAPRYGAAIEAVCNGEATRAEVPDVTSRREEIDHLLWKLARGTVTPESLREVIEDSL